MADEEIPDETQEEESQETTAQEVEDTEPDFDSLPEATKTEIRSLRRENQKLRRSVKDQQDQKAPAEKGKAQGDEISRRYEEAMTQLRTAKVELAVRQQAGQQAESLLDSRAFFAEVEDLDPDAPTFETDLRDVLKRHTKIKPRADKSGADLAGGKSSGNREFSSPQQRLAAAYAASTGT